MSKVNCAIYVRKSTEKGLEQEFNSLNNQEEACKNYILSQAFNSWEYYKTYEDGGISGGTMKRPGLQELIKDMKRGIIQTVVVYKVDRLSRSIMDFHNMMKEFDKYGCNFVSITQAFDTSNSMGKLTLNMLLSFAQFEREVSSERVRDKIRASKKKGLWTGGTPMLGYDVKEKHLEPNKHEAEIINTLFNQYMICKSLSKLKEYSDANKIKSKQWITQKEEVRGGHNLTTSMLARILKNKIYIGKIQNKKTGSVYPGKHKAIIDRCLFDEVQETLSNRKSNNTKTYIKDQYLLSGKIVDSNGNIFTNQKSAKSAVKKYRYYKQKGLYLPAGDIEKISVDTIKDFFDKALLKLLNQSKTIEFKSINWGSLSIEQQKELIKAMIDKVIYHENKLTYFINVDDVSYLKKFKIDNYYNTNNKVSEAYISEDKSNIIIEKQIFINNRVSSNKYEACGKAILTKSENANHLIKAMAYAWRYKKMYEQGTGIDIIRKQEAKSDRTIYKYISLSYLSPRIIANILDSDIPEHVNLQALFQISTEPDFIKQEKLFYK